MRNKWKLLLAVAALVLGGAAIWYWRGEELRAGVEATMVFLREAGPVAFFAAMALLPMAGFPMAPFILAAGPVFGPELGAGWVIACAVGAVAVNVALPGQPWLAGALFGAGAGLTADASWRLVCPVSDVWHVVAGHGGAVLVLTAMGSVGAYVAARRRLSARPGRRR
jgi:hypothetical protein